MSKLLLAYYADDFTGATDALDVLSRAGARTVLFTRPPDAEVLSRYGDLDAVGVAGRTRCLAPQAIEDELVGAFQTLARLDPEHIHYKVCSTFDSSPEVGSIGKAIDVGRRVVGSTYIPLVVGAPSLGRYCAFGSLFATTGVGQSGQVYRLDRHPSASKHPSTPMTESDLRVHLADQSDAQVALFDFLKLEMSEDKQHCELSRLISAKADVVLFDALDDQHIASIGALIGHKDFASRPQFSVGSSAIEMALGSNWKASGAVVSEPTSMQPEIVSQVLIVSGSCSPVTETQINWALQDENFAEIAIDTPALLASGGEKAFISDAAAQVVELLRAGKSVIVHTSKGLADPRFSDAQVISADWNLDVATRSRVTAEVIGKVLGQILTVALQETEIRRICIAGGDTAGVVALSLELESLEFHYPLAIGAPLCVMHAPGSPADGRQVNFKGGQVGRPDYFGCLLRGAA